MKSITWELIKKINLLNQIDPAISGSAGPPQVILTPPAQVQEPLVQRKGTGLWAGKLGPSVFPWVKGRIGRDQGTLVGGARQVTQSEVDRVGNVSVPCASQGLSGLKWGQVVALLCGFAREAGNLDF